MNPQSFYQKKTQYFAISADFLHRFGQIFLLPSSIFDLLLRRILRFGDSLAISHVDDQICLQKEKRKGKRAGVSRFRVESRPISKQSSLKIYKAFHLLSSSRAHRPSLLITRNVPTGRICVQLDQPLEREVGARLHLLRDGEEGGQAGQLDHPLQRHRDQG